eukprot:gene14599-4312_t
MKKWIGVGASAAVVAGVVYYITKPKKESDQNQITKQAKPDQQCAACDETARESKKGMEAVTASATNSKE